LDCLINREKQFSNAQITHCIKQLLSVLVYLHDRKIVHLDFGWTGNIYVTTKGVLKLGDFGNFKTANHQLLDLKKNRLVDNEEIFKAFCCQDIMDVAVVMVAMASGDVETNRASVDQFLRNDSKLTKQLKSLIRKCLVGKESARQLLDHRVFKQNDGPCAAI